MMKWLYILAVISGAAFMATGIWFAAMYVMEAIVKRMGEPDQSLVFWYIPILLIGMGGFMAGMLSFWWGLMNLRRTKQPKDSAPPAA
jgi:TRAP-type C4-dicarboxylate transport system permease small subunit